MTHQEEPFTYSLLESKLDERLDAALNFISRLTKEDVIQCDNGCLTELVRQFAVAAPILQLDSRVGDREIVELTDSTFERKTGDTGHIFLIPIERETEWLEEISSQKVSADGAPLAFLDKKRGQISVRLMLSPDDVDGTLKQKLRLRLDLVEQYANCVAMKLVGFNKELAEKMSAELDKRKRAITKAQRELEDVGLPQVTNPQHQERALLAERLLNAMGGRYLNASHGSSEEEGCDVRCFIVHGHDHASLFELKDYLQNTLQLGEPVILRKTPSLGKTLIEKFERESETVKLVFVLLTPDDEMARPTDSEKKKRRARQNVIFELGFFLGKLGRESGRVLLLHKGPIEMPSDILGVEYIDIANGIESAGETIRRELKALRVLK
jgi:predicted nucleotide-binding protein